MKVPSITTLFGLAQQQKLAQENEARRKVCVDAETAFYGFRDELKALVRDELKRISQIKPDKVQIVPLRIVKRLIGAMAMIYKDPAARAAGVAAEGGTLPPAAARYAETMAGSDIRQAAPRWDALARLHNTILVRPVWNRDLKRLEHRIYTPAHTDVEPSRADYLVPERVQYYVETTDASGFRVEETIEWTASTVQRVSKLGTAAAEGLADKRNPYGALPFAVLRLEDHGDFWGEGALDLVDATVAFLAQYAALLDNSLTQSFSLLLAVNLGLAAKTTLKSEQGVRQAEQVQMGNRTVVALELASNDVPQPRLEFATPEPLLEELTKVLNNLLQVVCWTYGLSAARVVNLLNGAVADTQESGVAKSMDNADLEELRQKHLESYRAFERDLYRVTAMVLKTDAKIDLPPVEDFTVDFAELTVRKTFGEIKAEREHRLAMNLATPVDFLIEENPDLDREQAEELVRANADLNEELAAGNELRRALQAD